MQHMMRLVFCGKPQQNICMFCEQANKVLFCYKNWIFTLKVNKASKIIVLLSLLSLLQQPVQGEQITAEPAKWVKYWENMTDDAADGVFYCWHMPNLWTMQLMCHANQLTCSVCFAHTYSMCATDVPCQQTQMRQGTSRWHVQYVFGLIGRCGEEYTYFC